MDDPVKQILLVEDDVTLQRSIKRGLQDQGYALRTVSSLENAWRVVEESVFDLLLLDLGLPDGHGFDFLKKFRAQHGLVPVIILTARDTLTDKISGLDLGADDFLVKPFDFQELSARIRAHLRRAAGQHSVMTIAGDLEIDLVKRTVKRAGLLIDCTPREFDVLVYLAKSRGQVVSRQMLMTDVWKIRSRMTSMDNVIDVLMFRLREKVDDGHANKMIRTIRGIGYTLDAAP